MRPRVEWLGNREVPLFIVDDVYLDPRAVKERAFEAQFPQSQAYYPGRHQPLDPESDPGIRAFTEHFAKLLSSATGGQIRASSIDTDFSILTTPEEMLLNNQGQPHIDGVPMLGVIYLSGVDYGGTAFFRNTETGSMVCVTPEQQKHYAALSDRHVASGQPSYVTDTTEDWERVIEIEGAINRFVMWPGTVFHAIAVKKKPENEALKEKRLTQRVVVNKFTKT
jgi:hypothetical protein